MFADDNLDKFEKNGQHTALDRIYWRKKKKAFIQKWEEMAV